MGWTEDTQPQPSPFISLKQGKSPEAGLSLQAGYVASEICFVLYAVRGLVGFIFFLFWPVLNIS